MRVLSPEVFLYFLSHELSRALRYRNFFCLSLLSVDCDQWRLDDPGATESFCRAIPEVIRRTDQIGRLDPHYGLVLLHLQADAALAVGERVLRCLGEVKVGVAPRISAAMGMACFPRDGQTEKTLLGHATRCLELARTLGGNRVVDLA